jgi:hypothetical protein
MAYPRWPEGLPQRPITDGFSRSFSDSRLISSMSTGPKKRRNRTSLAPTPVSMSFVLEWWQLARLNRFWLEDTGKGATPFYMPDMLYDGMPLFTDDGTPVLTDGDVPILLSADWLVVFDAKPTHEPFGLRWRASFSVEVMP